MEPQNDPLVAAKDELVELAETLSVNLEAQLNLEPTLSLPPAERRKASHRLLAQIKKIQADLRRLNLQAQNFAIHSV